MKTRSHARRTFATRFAFLVGWILVAFLAAGCSGPPDGSILAPTEDTNDVETPTPATSPGGIVLRQAPADLGCDSIGWEGEPYHTLTFHIDPAAADQVWAVADTGARLSTYWAAGFQPGSVEERVVRDSAGQIVASDGEVVQLPEAANPTLHGYLLCVRPDKLYVLPPSQG